MDMKPMDAKKAAMKNVTSGVEYPLLEMDPGFKKTEAAAGLLEGTHFVNEDEDEFEVDTLLHAAQYMLVNSGAPLSNPDIVSRLQAELDGHYLYQQLVLTEKRLGQLDKLHEYHDTFLKESRDALQQEIMAIEERFMGAGGKPLVDKDGNEFELPEAVATLDADMREIFKLVDDYNEIFDNYKLAIAELRKMFDASPATGTVLRNRSKRMQARVEGDDEEVQEPRVYTEGAPALSDLSYLLADRNPEIDVQIAELLRELQLFHGKRADLNARFDFLIQEIQKSGAGLAEYVPTKGDVVDEQLAVFINEAGLGELLRRQDHGQYCFGSKKISAKILNSQLIIRVGGGYCHIEEFISQYAKIEMMRMQAAQRLKMIQDKMKKKAKGTGAKSSKPVSNKSGNSSPKKAGAKSPRMSTGGFSPKTVDKVISNHEFLKQMEKEMEAERTGGKAGTRGSSPRASPGQKLEGSGNRRSSPKSSGSKKL